MQTFSIEPWRPLLSIWGNRHLIWQLSKRDVIGRYRGSMMGILWSFFNPLLMLAVYTFFFTEVFNARWRLESEGKGEFAIALFVGLIIHTFFAECAVKAPSLVVGNPSYVKRIVFPLEILPVVTVLSALFHMLISILVLAGFIIMVNGELPLTFFLFPVVALPLMIVACAAGWLLSALGVYLRDVAQTVGIIIMVMMYTSPLFFPVEVMPEKFRSWLYFNPLTLLMTEGRKLLIWGEVPNFKSISLYLIGACAASWLCFALFQKARRGFADVI
nr:ABC transporter permease [Pseudoxanthomonas sp.]